jgi:hypothetical protein
MSARLLALSGVAIALIGIAMPARGVVRTYSRTFTADQLTIDRGGGPPFDSTYIESTAADFNLPATAGAGDVIHIDLFLAPGLAFRFQPTADYYFVEAALSNDGGSVDTVGTAQLTFSGASNVKNLSADLDYETSILPTWVARQFPSRSQFLFDTTQPAFFSDIHATFTIPAGYPTANFADVTMFLGCGKNLSFNQPPPPPILTIVPEPACIGVIGLGLLAIAMRRRHDPPAHGHRS